jgi:hypothetical protein
MHKRPADPSLTFLLAVSLTDASSLFILSFFSYVRYPTHYHTVALSL